MDIPKRSAFDRDTIRRFSRLPALEAFAHHVESRLSYGGADAVSQCKSEMESLMAQGFIADVFRTELEEMVREPCHMPVGTLDTMMLVRNRTFSLLLRKSVPEAEGERSLVFSLVEHFLLAVAGPSALEVDVFAETPGYASDVLDRTRTLGARETRTVAPGEVVEFRAGRDCLFATRTKDVSFSVQLITEHVRRVQWVYDAATLKAVRVQAADPTSSRLEFAAQMLAELRGDGAAASLSSLCEHPDHFVRWNAIRNLTRIDFHAGVAKLQRAVDDVHPHVRNAAVRALRKMESDGVLGRAPVTAAV